ncbi:hypothetical protein P692DRAFT_20838055, partial [Suillus brevipes Sb2]
MGMAEINDAKAATMIAEEKRIVCDSCDIESGKCRKMGMAFMCWMLFSNIRLAWLGLQTNRLCNTCQQIASKFC